MKTDVAVIGGGLGGLAAAILLRRTGKTVAVLERSSELGGRARSNPLAECTFNLGPHALYRGGRAAEVLAELGVRYTGGVPGGSGNYALQGSALHTLPSGPISLMTTDLLGLSEKLELMKLFATLRGVDPAPYMSTTVEEYAARHVHHRAVRDLFGALIRVATYVNAPAVMSAGAAIEQFQLAFKKNVLYLDGGWQSLVDELRRIALAEGVDVRTGARVEAVEHDARELRGVRLAAGELHEASAVVIAAGGPQLASALVDGGQHPVLQRWAREELPARAACLDVVLDQLPRPHARFALGLDTPVYVSVHSAVARLGPPGKVVLHAAQYLARGAEGAAALPELERALDLLQPGWRDHAIERRFLPDMTVVHGIPAAAIGGCAGRPGPEVPGIRGLYVVGDWVGPEGMLADASLASAAQVTRLALSARAVKPVAATQASA